MADPIYLIVSPFLCHEEMGQRSLSRSVAAGMKPAPLSGNIYTFEV